MDEKDELSDYNLDESHGYKLQGDDGFDKRERITLEWVAEKLYEELKADLRMSREAMLAIFLKRFGLQVSYMKLWRARKVAHEWNEGNHVESYAMLPSYARLVVQTNPGSMFILQYEDRQVDMSTNPVFKRCFECYKTCRDGFVNGCRKFVELDGCHLKGRFGGVLLSAIAVDGNNSIFPLAFGVVEIENKSSWSFFLDCLHDALGDASDNNTLTFMSENQKGLAKIIDELFPYSNIRCCSRHLYQNFKAKFPGSILRRYYWAVSETSTLVLFQKAMDTIKSIDNAAYEWLNRKSHTLWSRHAFDLRCKNDFITNNLTESFNNWVGSLKSKPVLNLLDSFRMKVMERLYNRYQKGCPYESIITPKVLHKTATIKEQSIHCHVFVSSPYEFEVAENFVKKFVVNLKKRRCICRVWESNGVPCKHAAAAISYKRGIVEDYCDECYSKQRPHKNKRREPDEGALADFRKRSRTVRCDSYKGLGHNKRRCERAPVKEKGASSSTTSRSKKVDGNCKGLGHNKRRCERAPVKEKGASSSTTSRSRKVVYGSSNNVMYFEVLVLCGCRLMGTILGCLKVLVFDGGIMWNVVNFVLF
ncbi:uncharacterized protein LOC122655369 [Telopea speciosissima]|uniref:uncharacterized protein LOC122655369 n=1 Tax=Telopea speciosissima TaxID=54955 RepID=UPI001CC367C2|nr:uncharacterized protein LOC122655369 [Telopea speciosissima]